ncbi:unnamed protein product, partial [marine sediment metagenome]
LRNHVWDKNMWKGGKARPIKYIKDVKLIK